MPRRRLFALTCAVGLATVGYQAWQIHLVATDFSEREAECAIVLGAAAWHNKPSPVLEGRLRQAVRLYLNGRVKTLILTGGYGTGADFAESEVARSYCVDHGVKSGDILIERSSHDTLGNLQQAARLMREQDWTSALIVSDPWHLKRAVLMAQHYGIEAAASPTESSEFRSAESRSQFFIKEIALLNRFYLQRSTHRLGDPLS